MLYTELIINYMNNFIDQADLISPLSTETKEDLLKNLKVKHFKKGEIMYQKDKICRSLFFVKEGLLKHFHYHKDNQYILRFFKEDDFLTISDSFLNNSRADYCSKALEDTTLIYLEYNTLERLCDKHHSLERFLRKFITSIAATSINRFKNMLYSDATERYQIFLSEYSHLQERISLGDTASFLGISQVSLSRIRSKR